MRYVFPILALASAVCGRAADVPTQPLAPKGTSIFADDFERVELGEKWRVTTPTFAIAEGVLRGSQTKPEHGAVGRVNVGVKDLVVELKFRFEGASNINVVCNERGYKESHGGHLCRVSLSSRQLFLGDDKERLSSTIEEMRKDPARKAEVAKLVAGRSVGVAMPFEQGRWYRLTWEIVGDEMRASIDGKPVGYLKSSGIAHPVKTDFHITVSGKDALFDDVQVWRAEAAGAKEDAYEKVYAAWRATLEEELKRNLSKVRGDAALRQTLAQAAPQHLPFLRGKLKEDFFSVLVLEGSPLEELYRDAIPPGLGLQDRRDQWLRVLERHRQ